MERIEVTFAFTKDEYLQAERQYLIAGKTVTRSGLIIIPIFFTYALLTMFTSGFHFLSVIAFLLVSYSLASLYTLYVYTPNIRFKQAAGAGSVCSLGFSLDGIHYRSEGGDTRVDWEVYTEVWENTGYYYLLQTKRVYSIIPKRAFLEPEDLRGFEAILLSRFESVRWMERGGRPVDASGYGAADED